MGVPVRPRLAVQKEQRTSAALFVFFILKWYESYTLRIAAV